MATSTGITSLLGQIGPIAQSLKSAGIGQPVSLTGLDQRAANIRDYLGQTDYSKQLQEAQDLGKLQLALALAQRGFAAAGATPKRGEAPLSTISRELFSPVAGDAGAVASQMMQQRRAIENARAQEDRQVKLAALSQALAAKKTRDDYTMSLLSGALKSKPSDTVGEPIITLICSPLILLSPLKTFISFINLAVLMRFSIIK